jgi:hypothetical protein
MRGCCSAFQGKAELQFDEVKAGVLSGTVIDVGSGVGALTFALLDRGAANAIATAQPTANVDLVCGRLCASQAGVRTSIARVIS